uniref:Temporin-1ITa n=1 Tax=Rana italica TaxID=147302 RepID=TP1A_RANIT|nr:RecName: Full=Temporin-1ITa [Rana italica]
FLGAIAQALTSLLGKL